MNDLIAEGLSDVQVRSITNSVEGELREKAKIEPLRKEGLTRRNGPYLIMVI